MKAKRSYSEFTITIVSYAPTLGTPGKSSGLGHAFILFHSNSSIPITVGHMLVMPRDYIPVGIFDAERAPNEKNSGVWYNYEAWAIRDLKFF